VILNGAGYDAWAQRLLDANPVPGRTVIDVAKLAHVARGGNPHLWYSPAVVAKVVATLSAALPNPHAVDLGHYRAEIALIRRRFSGAPVGASESIFAPLASALGLRLLTPSSFLGAISEGTEPTVADLATIGSQIAHRKIRVWVFNTQNATPDVRGLTQAAQHAGIPVVDVTETLAPAGATFQAWQLRQLRALAAALAAAHA
jgi:zinc/manganese transport system substrate-binding protein